MMLQTAKKIIYLFLIFSTIIFAQNKTTLKLNLTEKKLPFGLTEKIPSNLPKIGLALSGGGARAISQIGVLKALEKKNIPIEIIVGTSMGSIIGGLYSAGYSLADLDSMLLATRWDDFFSAQQSNRNELFIDQKITEDKAILSFRMDGLNPIIPTSFSTGQRAANFLTLMAISAPIINEESYDSLKYKFRAVSSDLISGREVIIGSGSLGAAMRASSSVTLLLPPVKIDSLLLVDGGLVANIPAKETWQLGAEIVISVDSSSPLYNEEELKFPWTIADQLVSIPMKILNEQQIKKTDFLITPKLEGKKNSDFSDLSNVILRGYEAAEPIVENVEKEFVRLFKQKLGGVEKTFSNLMLKPNASQTEKKLFEKFAGSKIVSNGDLLFELYKIFSEGYWRDLSIDIIEEKDKSVLSVAEEKNTLVEKIELQGVVVINDDAAKDIFSTLKNAPYSPRKTFDAMVDLLRLYKRNGYSFARIERIYFDEYSRSLSVVVDEGVISKIVVEGNHKTKGRIITREFPLREGGYFKYELAERGLTNLRSTNLFDQIELTVTHNNGNNELKISLIEKISSIIRFGMRIDNEYQTQISFDMRNENFNGTGTEIGATISGGARNRYFGIEQKANRVFDSYFTYKVRAFYEFNDVNVYEDIAAPPNRFKRIKTGVYRQIFYGGSFGFGRQVERFGNLFAEARYQRDEIKNKLDYAGSTYKVDISSLRFSLFIDSQNEYPYPTAGFLINGFYETAQSALGGDIGYTKIYFDYKNIFSYRNYFVWSFRAVIGSADKTLPLSEQFSLGGQNLFFGLRDHEFRGRQIFLISLEHRYKLPFKLFFDTYAEARYDLGSIWAEREQIRFKDLKHGIGATLSFDTPLGPADFSVGKSFYIANKLTNNRIVWGETFFYFTIGYYY